MSLNIQFRIKRRESCIVLFGDYLDLLLVVPSPKWMQHEHYNLSYLNNLFLDHVSSALTPWVHVKVLRMTKAVRQCADHSFLTFFNQRAISIYISLASTALRSSGPGSRSNSGLRKCLNYTIY